MEGQGYGEYDDYEDEPPPHGKILKDFDDIDYNNFNLNKLSQEELKKHKDKMNVDFMKNS